MFYLGCDVYPIPMMATKNFDHLVQSIINCAYQMKGYIKKNNAYNLPCLLSDAEDDEDDDEEL
jgi:hypothetical protein